MKYLILLVTIFLLGCSKQRLVKFAEYTIKEGEHSSILSFNTFTVDELTFDAKFDESAKYESLDPVNQYDINKLFGFSECNDLHQENSARFGWRWLNDGIEIHAYVYNDGVRYSEYITSVNPNETHSYSIKIKDDSYIFAVDNNVSIVKRTNKCEMGLYYKLYPYFGGDEKAPHDIRILIKEPLSR